MIPYSLQRKLGLIPEENEPSIGEEEDLKPDSSGARAVRVPPDEGDTAAVNGNDGCARNLWNTLGAAEEGEGRGRRPRDLDDSDAKAMG